jgi:hypothetical protein
LEFDAGVGGFESPRCSAVGLVAITLPALHGVLHLVVVVEAAANALPG